MPTVIRNYNTSIQDFLKKFSEKLERKTIPCEDG